jgi:Ca2+-binding RTX toxin-like protein
MTSFVITGIDGIGHALADGESGIITRGGVLTQAVVMQSNSAAFPASFVVQGALATRGIAVVLDTATGDANVSVSQGGSIVGAAAIYGSTASNDLFLSNAGMIEGFRIGGIVSTGAANVTVTNSGIIQCGTQGFESFFSGQRAAINVRGNALSIDNIGTIAAPGNAIIAGDTTVTALTNSGTISAGIAIDLGDSGDTVENAGTIRGRILLDGGADSFDGRFGRQTGLVFGGDGIDTLRGGVFEDRYYGGLNNDLVYGGGADDTLIGDAGDDMLRGGQGDDLISGGAGNDTITGGADDDSLSGGAGADTFVFARGQGTDRVTDFVNNVDKLDLRAFDFASFAAVKAVSDGAVFGLKIDVPGEGVIFVTGLTVALFTPGDVLL